MRLSNVHEAAKVNNGNIRNTWIKEQKKSLYLDRLQVCYLYALEATALQRGASFY